MIKNKNSNKTSNKKKKVKMIGGTKWTRVFGPDLYDTTGRMDANTNRMTDKLFKRTCNDAGVEPTRRQASKWNNKKGKAYKWYHKIDMTGVVFA